MQTIRVAAAVSLLMAMSGCSVIRGYTMPDEDNLLSGAGSIIVKSSGDKQSAEAFEQINIDQLLFDYGLSDLPTVSGQTNSEGYKYRRNELQDRLIAVSNQRCATYLRVMTSSKAQSQMGWGGLATLLSGAASVTTPASAARILSAASTVSNGLLSKYNEAYFNNLTVQVISTGITKQREVALVNIQKQRDASLVTYPVNRAIADALNYHAMCNVVAGLEMAAAATKNSSATAEAEKSALKVEN
ncbi:hypothetical protein GL58_07200 [Comamonas testosteroni]|uniref:Lipoprotein n=2 Tax=Comamonas testosteroni TaxID=285 RepID=A0A0L7MK20_COMTE|nr:hypothetical protein [Comamonas testosteroni]KOC22247.1 hypothetical protein GL58_07200 [Comamonas testosteroni]